MAIKIILFLIFNVTMVLSKQYVVKLEDVKRSESSVDDGFDVYTWKDENDNNFEEYEKEDSKIFDTYGFRTRNLRGSIRCNKLNQA